MSVNPDVSAVTASFPRRVRMLARVLLKDGCGVACLDKGTFTCQFIPGKVGEINILG